MIPNHRGSISPKMLQEYLEALSESRQGDADARPHKFLFSFAELRYHVDGGSRCGICNAHVRHVVPVTVEHQDGTLVEYPCMCVRCLAAEKATSKRITLRIGQAAVEYTSNSKLNGSGPPAPKRFSQAG